MDPGAVSAHVMLTSGKTSPPCCGSFTWSAKMCLLLFGELAGGRQWQLCGDGGNSDLVMCAEALFGLEEALLEIGTPCHFDVLGSSRRRPAGQSLCALISPQLDAMPMRLRPCLSATSAMRASARWIVGKNH